MFLQVSVILFTGGWGVPGPGRGACSGGGAWSRRGACSWGGAWSRGDACSGEGCLLRGGPAPGGVPGGDPSQTATAAGGTHPTGMHSIFSKINTSN